LCNFISENLEENIDYIHDKSNYIPMFDINSTAPVQIVSKSKDKPKYLNLDALNQILLKSTLLQAKKHCNFILGCYKIIMKYHHIKNINSLTSELRLINEKLNTASIERAQLSTQIQELSNQNKDLTNRLIHSMNQNTQAISVIRSNSSLTTTPSQSKRKTFLIIMKKNTSPKYFAICAQKNHVTKSIKEQTANGYHETPIVKLEVSYAINFFYYCVNELNIDAKNRSFDTDINICDAFDELHLKYKVELTQGLLQID
jgi:hypothetical protein